MDLQLFCQAPGQWHPASVGNVQSNTMNGLYQVKQPTEWWYTISPYVRRMVSVLKFAAPLIGPWVNFISSEEYEKRFKNDIKLMEELVLKLPEMREAKTETFDDPRKSVFFLDSYTERVEGAALRALRRLLEEKDPQQHWGGLKRKLTPEGHFLWLCQHHAAEYAQ